VAECKIPDEETRAQKARDYDDEMSTMRFQSVKIRFYPEDEAKMAAMDHKEKMDYVRWLRQENRYVEVYDESEDL